MSDDDPTRDDIDEPTDDLSLSRRDSLAALAGFGGLGATGAAGASSPLYANHGDPEGATRRWNQHIDAQDHDLHNLHSVDVGHVYTSARAADALVWQDDEGTYHADTAEETVHSGEDFTTAVQAAIDSLSDDRTTKEKVVVACSGTMGPHEWDGDVLAIEIPSYTIVDFQGTIYVEDEEEALIRPLRARDAVEIEIPRVQIIGNFRSAIWFKGVRRVTFGHVDIRTPEDSVISGTGGGVRIDAGRDIFDEPIRSTDIQIGSCYIEKTVGHAFETYNVDRIQIGQVIANNPNFAGVLLNATTDATVGAIVAKDVDVGGGYAGFRVANGSHDVTCDQVVVHGGARGVFGVSACSEITIGEVNIRGMDAHGILIQDCQNFTIEGGVVKNCIGEAIRVDSRSSPQHPPAEGVNVSNVRVVDTQDEKTQTYGINETGPGTNNNRFTNNDLRDAGTEANMSLFAPSTIVRDNTAGGVAYGTVTLTSGASPAATVENVTENGNVTLDLRAKPRTAPGSAFAYDHRFEWTGSQWNLVIEWETDPDEDVDLDYIVDRPQASLGIETEDEDDDGAATPTDGETFTMTSMLNADDVLVSVEGTPSAGANVYNQTAGEESFQQWTLTDLGDGNWRVDAAGTDADLVLAAADGGTDTGTQAVVETWSDAAHQKWEFVENGQGYMLQPTHANLALDVWERDSSPGADLRHWTPSGDSNQTFLLSQAGDSASFPFETSEGVVESFEDGNLDGYNGATGDYVVNQDAPVADGSYSLKGSGGGGSRLVTTDLDRSPAPGTTFSAKIGWTNDAQNAGFAFGANETTAPAEGDSFPFHFVRIWRSGEDDWRFQFWDRTGAQRFDNSLGATQSDGFYEVVVNWSQDGSMTLTLNDPDGNELATESVDDVGTDWGDGGIGTRGTGLLDDVRILENRR